MHRHQRAFTLVELLVTIAIIGVLSTLATISVTYARNRAKIVKAQHDVDTLVTAAKMLETDTGYWPLHQTVDEVTTAGTNEAWDLSAPAVGLVATDGGYPRWNGPYIGRIPTDPWGHAYFYDSDYRISGINRVVIGSFGPNGVGPNLYDSDDIIKILH